MGVCLRLQACATAHSGTHASACTRQSSRQEQATHRGSAASTHLEALLLHLPLLRCPTSCQQPSRWQGWASIRPRPSLCWNKTGTQTGRLTSSRDLGTCQLQLPHGEGACQQQSARQLGGRIADKALTPLAGLASCPLGNVKHCLCLGQNPGAATRCILAQQHGEGGACLQLQAALRLLGSTSCSRGLRVCILGHPGRHAPALRQLLQRATNPASSGTEVLGAWRHWE